MRHRRGFTLIELIIYVGIFSLAATLLTGVLTTFTKVQLRESATTAVSQEAQFVIQTIQRLVTDASLIELAKDTASSTLKLRMPVAAQDPTCIQFSNGTVYLMQGNDGINKQTCLATSTSQAKALTTSKVVVNTLTFKKFENPPAGDTVKIDLTASYNSTNPQESVISRTLQTAIAKVSAATFDSDIIPSADNTYNVGVGANRWKDGLFSNSLLVGYTSVTGGVAAFNGNVGIGTNSPIARLQVSGGGILLDNAQYLTAKDASSTPWNLLGIMSTNDVVLQMASTTNNLLFRDGVGAEKMRITGSGNVGIGTVPTSGWATGAKAVQVGTGASGSLYGRSSSAGITGNAYYDGTNWRYMTSDGAGHIYFSPTTIEMQVAPSGTAGSAITWTNAVSINNSGNVGIGTTSPVTHLTPGLTVNGLTPGLDLRESDAGVDAKNYDLHTDTNHLYGRLVNDAMNSATIWLDVERSGMTVTDVSFPNGNVGIGTASPSTKLHVVGSGIEPVFFTTSGSDGALSILSLYGSGGADREFYFNNGGSAAADGTFSGGGADYAEFFENLNREVVPPGTIVALDTGQVRVARRGDSFIAGVVSTSPGLVGNNGDTEEDRGNHPERWTLVALMGQVPVKVRGPVEHGDYIELDDNGVARRAAQWHPDVLGRAMESREAPDIGPIKVLIK